MNRVLAMLALSASIVGLAGCGKPPQEVARKMALNYLESNGLILDDIKYLSAYSKDGGYTVNIQAGDALCEMPMIKGEKDWMSKGISCNGKFLSQEETNRRKKAQISEELKKEVAADKAKGPQVLESGVRIEKSAFDGTRLAWLLTYPKNTVEFTDKMKKALMAEVITNLCVLPSERNVLAAGFSYGFDINSVEGQPVLSFTVNAKDCE